MKIILSYDDEVERWQNVDLCHLSNHTYGDKFGYFTLSGGMVVLIQLNAMCVWPK